MLKRARRVWTEPGSSAERLLHECTVAGDRLRLRTWIRQADGVNRPGDGGAGGNVFGEELDPRLTGMLLTPAGDVTVPWDHAAMRDGAVHYVSTLFDGAPAPEAYRVMELDQMAALATAARRQAALYPHWHHKQHVYVFGFLQHLFETTGVGLIPALKIVADGQPADGFLDAGVIVEARLGPLGFVGEFDPALAGNGVVFRDARETLADGSPNPDFARFSVPPEMPAGWEFG